MKIHIKSFKYFTVIATVLSAIFIFPSWFNLPSPVFKAMAESDSLQISFFSLPEFITEQGMLQRITSMAGKTASIILLFVCTTLKYMCVLSAGLGLYGAIKICVKDKPSRFILSSQIIVLVLSLISIIVVVCFALVMNLYPKEISAMIGINIKIIYDGFMPTVWFYLSVASSVSSIVFWSKYRKE